MIKKILVKREIRGPGVSAEAQTYNIEHIDKEFHCSDGMFAKDDLKKSKGSIKTNMGKEFYIMDAQFIDAFKNIRKSAQTIPLKDLGFIFAETGLDKRSVVVDTGSGSGASACFFGRYVKKVYTYDINDVNLEQTRKNVAYFGLKNVVVEKNDSYQKIPNKNVDMMLVDVPEPWHAIPHAHKALKQGGFLVSYCPQIIQSQQFVNAALEQGFLHVKSVEMVERDWKIEGNIVRPKSLSNIHSGFISILRKIN